MRRRVVDGNAGVLGQRHHDKRDAGERHAGVDHQLAVRDRLDDGGERRRMRDERGGEEHHQQRRLREEADHHFAARAKRAERSADVHSGQRDEQACQGEQADQRNGIGGLVQRQVGPQGRDDGGGERQAAEDQVGRRAEERRGVVRKNDFLLEQLGQHAVRLEDAGCALVLQPGAALVDPAGQQRREQNGERQLGELGGDAGSAHRTKSSSRSRVAKLYIRYTEMRPR